MTPNNPPSLPFDQAKHWLDYLALSTAFASFVGALPAIAAALSIIWTGIRIYETKTIQRWLGKSKQEHA
jgi:hypothetical protein